MSSATYEISSSRARLHMTGEPVPKRRGCFVGVAGWLCVVFWAAVVATAVGLLVYFLHPDRDTDDTVTMAPTAPTGDPTCSGDGDCEVTTAGPVIDYRLSLDLIPVSYVVRLRPFFYGDRVDDFHVNGSVDALFNVTRSISEIVIHKKDMTIDDTTIRVSRSADDSTVPVHSGRTSYDSVREFFTIPLGAELVAGESYRVYMEFRTPLRQELKGIYLSEYTDGEGRLKYIATSHTHPTEARKEFPCFDEPQLKATFSITLERKAHMKSFCNAGVKTETPLEDNWVADEYVPTPPMSTYILAFMVSEFECLNTTTSNQKMVFVCSRPEYVEQARHAISIAGEMQEFFESYHAVPYPLPITVHMAVPDFSAGAMENWGLIFYRETALLFDENSSSAANKQRVTVVLAHELSHMWFGNLVTPAWWDDIWLNEGFASYMEIICTDNTFPEWDMDGQFVTDDLQSVMRTDSLASSHPIYQHVYDTTEINELFDSIAYSKGASIIRMMRYFLGDETFRVGISKYLQNMEYQAAHHNDLFRTMTKQAIDDGLVDVNVTEIMQTWILQLGYPLVHFSHDSNSGDVTLTQKHFLLDPTQVPRESPFNYQWIVPISIVTDGGDFNSPVSGWLREKSGVVATNVGNAQWIIGNPKQRYYYRVNYDLSMWDAIITQLESDHTIINSNNRAQLIDDSFNLARSGDLDIEVSLNVTRYLVREEAYVPWKATYENLDYMSRMLQMSGNYGYLQQYVQRQIQPIYNKLGYEDNPRTDPHIEQRHRVITLDMACGFGMADCLDKATDQFRLWMAEPQPNVTNPISNNLRGFIYCSALRGGGVAEWEFAWRMYESAPSSSERTTLLEALACTREVHLLAGLLDRTLRTDGIRLQDFDTVVSSVAANPVGRALAWNFLRQNWDQLLTWFGEIIFTLPRAVEGTTRSFSTEWELKELEDFKADTENLATATRVFDQAIESTKSNIEWRTANEARIVNWVKGVL